MKRLWPSLLFGVLLTAVLFSMDVIYSKSGGETFSILFFPFTSLLGLILSSDSSNLAVGLGYTLFFLQYPLYSVILKIARPWQVLQVAISALGPTHHVFDYVLYDLQSFPNY